MSCSNAKRKQVMTHDLHGLHVHEAKDTVGGILQGLCSMPPEAFTGISSVSKLHKLCRKHP